MPSSLLVAAGIDIKVKAAIMGEYEKLAVLGTHKIASLSELWYYYHLFQKNVFSCLDPPEIV